MAHPANLSPRFGQAPRRCGRGKALHTCLSTKGNFEWGENVEPYYAWFDDEVEYTLPTDTVDPTKVVEINRIKGDATDGKSRIWPFKRMEGRQAYDSVSASSPIPTSGARPPTQHCGPISTGRRRSRPG